jgi:hypothetical protein
VAMASNDVVAFLNELHFCHKNTKALRFHEKVLVLFLCLRDFKGSKLPAMTAKQFIETI